MNTGCPMRQLMRLLSRRSGVDDPYPAFNAIREAGPSHQTPFFGHVLTRYDDVEDVLFDRSLQVSAKAAASGSARAALHANLPDDLAALPPPLFLMDEPDHKRIRRALAPAFSQRAIERLKPRIEAISNELLDALSGRREFDLVDAFAAPLPARVIAVILGIADNRLHEFRQHSEDIIHELNALATPAERERSSKAHRALVAFFDEQIDHRRHSPGDDLISTLLARSQNEDGLTTEEINAVCVNLLVAGHFTTTDLISSLTWLLLNNPDAIALLRTAPNLWDNAISEALRLEPPTPLLARVCPKARHFTGGTAQPGESINLFVASANRDPRKFADPDAFDISRAPNEHLSFGGGAHFCLGALLAREEARIGVELLFQRFPNLALSKHGAQWRRTPNFRGLERLHLDIGSQTLTEIVSSSPEDRRCLIGAS
jgi:cytochrome P450